MRNGKSRDQKKRIAIYVRCRFCGKVFEGSSDKSLVEWSEHITSCEKKHKGSR